MEIKEITKEEVNKLLNSAKTTGPYSLEWEPRGLFYTVEKDSYENNLYIGIDNSTGDCWTEEFHSKEKCIAWLKGEHKID